VERARLVLPEAVGEEAAQDEEPFVVDASGHLALALDHHDGPAPGGGDAGDAGPGGPGGDGGPYKAGGFVNIGNPKSQTDDVPAMLQHGEYVVPRSAMARLADKTGGFQQAAQKVKEMILKFSNDGKSSVHFKERG